MPTPCCHAVRPAGAASLLAPRLAATDEDLYGKERAAGESIAGEEGRASRVMHLDRCLPGEDNHRLPVKRRPNILLQTVFSIP